ncbi:hypothetical protein, variant [Spizellomyces punctatus DAOM BR117]|uniref:U2A'/phosphoprotein 32 family A C-terminal domain-containing protein n=1 Tax=Spizellomyces punctatus (strain DAOM BR117) TaxID=645134 RepID=A0A0L0HVN3_SPIPD|nr:hypothetical protein, variant [Spizellomyces punctatus DAOM BR117]KND04944.1 hypothetical protein, variant [Spizellomyces punctatus DAOM BR117]|eukprot:XP_016612983.1 hypothetical protein, variant [Spizellomyces punctatus DAOM BR117]
MCIVDISRFYSCRITKFLKSVENLHKLKELKYLQLALNNVSKIENLEGCEALEKLDLTVNFVEDPLDVECLKGNEMLRELFLVGNPCTQKEGYREFVITTLPQLKNLDGRDITRSERIEAAQVYENVRKRFIREREERTGTVYEAKVEAEPAPQKANDHESSKAQYNENSTNSSDSLNEGRNPTPASGDIDELEEKRWRFQNEPVPHTPSARLEAARDLASMREGKNNQNPPTKQQQSPTPLFAPDGRVLQKNQGKWPFHFAITTDTITLHVELSKFVDTSLIDVDVQPTWLRISVKGKILQLVLDEEVQTENVLCERSRVTGWLAVTMVKAHVDKTKADVIEIRNKERRIKEDEERQKRALQRKQETSAERKKNYRTSFTPTESVDLRNIVADAQTPTASAKASIFDRTFSIMPPVVPDDFEDDPSVPPLC